MTRRYGRSLRGRPVYGSVPHNRGKNLTVVGAVSATAGLVAWRALDGGMDGAAFLSFVTEALIPALRPGQTVVMDNLNSHKTRAVRDAFAAHLGGVRLAPAVATLWRELVGEMARDASADARRRGVELRRQRGEEDARRVRAEELYIDGKLDRAALDRASARADERLATLDAQLAEADAGADVEHAAHVRYAINVLADLPGLWERADAEGRRLLAGSIWPAGLVYDGGGFGTGPESPVIALFQSVGAETIERRPSREDRRPVQWSVAESNR